METNTPEYTLWYMEETIKNHEANYWPTHPITLDAIREYENFKYQQSKTK